MSVQTKEQLLKLIVKHQQQIQAFGVQRCGLFGSFVHGETTPQSDIDILVEFEPGKKSFGNFMGLAFFFEDLFERDELFERTQDQLGAAARRAKQEIAARQTKPMDYDQV